MVTRFERPWSQVGARRRRRRAPLFFLKPFPSRGLSPISLCRAGYNQRMPTSPRIASIYIQHRTRSLGQPFDYRIPERLAGEVINGSVVLVPLGRQKALGIVAALSLTSKIAESRLVEIAELVDYPPIPEPLIELALWVSDYYYCAPATALTLVLPPGGLPSLIRSGSGKEAFYTLKAPSIKPRCIRM